MLNKYTVRSLLFLVGLSYIINYVIYFKHYHTTNNHSFNNKDLQDCFNILLHQTKLQITC